MERHSVPVRADGTSIDELSSLLLDVASQFRGISVKKPDQKGWAMDPQTVNLIIDTLKEVGPALIPSIIGLLAKAWTNYREKKKPSKASTTVGRSSARIIIETEAGNIRLDLDKVESIESLPDLPKKVNEIVRIRLEG